MTRRQLANLFRAERRAFASRFPRVRRASLYLGRRPKGAPLRSFAQAETGGRAPRVTLFAEALRLPRRNILGLIRHELGHVADPTPRRRGKEQRADDIAEAVSGARIRYELPAAVQSVGRGVYPRPCWIHQ